MTEAASVGGFLLAYPGRRARQRWRIGYGFGWSDETIFQSLRSRPEKITR